ncbi:MAG: HGGxSTG domain-containing protein [Pseudomonadota bacterium]
MSQDLEDFIRRARERFEALGREPWRIDAFCRLYRVGKWRRAHRVIEGRVCAARCKKGGRCIATPIRAGGRCRHHGGLSTGPRTVEGRAKIAAAQRRRWAKWQAEHGAAR